MSPEEKAQLAGQNWHKVNSMWAAKVTVHGRPFSPYFYFPDSFWGLFHDLSDSIQQRKAARAMTRLYIYIE